MVRLAVGFACGGEFFRAFLQLCGDIDVGLLKAGDLTLEFVDISAGAPSPAVGSVCAACAWASRSGCRYRNDLSTAAAREIDETLTVSPDRVAFWMAVMTR